MRNSEPQAAPDRLNSLAAAELRAELGRQDLTRTRLAALAKMPPSQVHTRLAGTTRLDLGTFVALAQALNVPAPGLLERVLDAAAADGGATR